MVFRWTCFAHEKIMFFTVVNENSSGKLFYLVDALLYIHLYNFIITQLILKVFFFLPRNLSQLYNWIVGVIVTFEINLDNKMWI